jgi:putative molybdopterin biosynthesis protein
VIEPIAAEYGLGFLPLQAEQFDFVIPLSKWDRPAVAAFRELLASAEVRRHLSEAGFDLTEEDKP